MIVVGAKRPAAWSEEDTAKARQLLADKAGPEIFASVLGRSKGAAVARMRYVNDPEGYRHSRCRKKVGSRRVETVDRFYVPEEVIESATRRLCTDRSLTAIIFGDPAPGFSALDRRNAGGAA